MFGQRINESPTDHLHLCFFPPHLSVKFLIIVSKSRIKALISFNLLFNLNCLAIILRIERLLEFNSSVDSFSNGRFYNRNLSLPLL
jgi:hypothetical protein